MEARYNPIDALHDIGAVASRMWTLESFDDVEAASNDFGPSNMQSLLASSQKIFAICQFI